MSGLLALLDDVAAIAKVAAASVDDIAAGAAQAGAKAAGVVIDDAAVTPSYVTGFEAKRELPIIWRIAKGSVKNKLVYLLPLALGLANFAPWGIVPLLTAGGLYLCFEGAEKIAHKILPQELETEEDTDTNPLHLEEEKVAGAIKTDFILSAEIMTIALASIPAGNWVLQAATLALVGVGITALVYGSVGLIVKMDDIGLFMARRGRLGLTRGFGRGLVVAMPKVMTVLSVVGTAAMLWVGGSIVIHGMEAAGLTWLGHHITDLAKVVSAMVPQVQGFADWLVKAAMDGVFGLILGIILMPIAKLIVPLWGVIFGGKAAQ